MVQPVFSSIEQTSVEEVFDDIEFAVVITVMQIEID